MPSIIKVALFGPMKSGKTTLANILRAHFYSAPLNNSLRLKQMVAMLNDEPMSRMDDQDFKDESPENNYGKTNREMMTMLGTDLIRKQHHPDQWADIIKRQVTFVDKAGVNGVVTLNFIDNLINALLDARHHILKSDGGEEALSSIMGTVSDELESNLAAFNDECSIVWIRSDDRYPNESIVSKDAGFFMIYVDREEAKKYVHHDAHDSEQHYAEMKHMADYVLDNNSSLDQAVDTLLAVIQENFDGGELMLASK